jgi:cardiolipin synthase
VAVVPSGPDQDVNANAMVYFSGITIARQRVLLTSPYFVPDEPTLQALISSAMRGVDVKILVPAISDVRLMRLAARSYYRDLLMAGVRVFEYQPSMLHAKTMIVDGRWCIVGSANVDIRSFRLNFEVGALIFDSKFAKELEKRFYLDLAKSHEVTLSNLLRDNYLQKLSMGAVRLLSPLL